MEKNHKAILQKMSHIKIKEFNKLKKKKNPEK